MTETPASRHPGRGRAFTIVEVLATLTLTAIVLPPVVHGILLCLAAAEHAGQQARAASLAQGVLAEIVTARDFQNAQMTGDFGQDVPEYTWAAHVGDWQDQRLAQLDVSVMWTRRGREYSVTLSTLVHLEQAGE